MKCQHCPNDVEKDREEVLNSRICSKCARVSPPAPSLDPNIVCARSSISSANGFAPKD